MKRLSEKFKKQGGFTLVEMLIVVAIIAILIAISIPMVGSALEKSRHAVDQANIRDAISLGSIKYLSEDLNTTTETTKIYKYVVNSTTHQGELIESAGSASYGGTEVTPKCTCSEFKEALTVTVNTKTGEVTPNWMTDNDASGDKKGMTKAYSAPST